MRYLESAPMLVRVRTLTWIFLAAGASAPLASAAAQGAPARVSYHYEFPLFAPRVFGTPALSSGDYETHLALTPDGKTAYFVKSTWQFDYWTIMVSSFKGGKWERAEIAPFSGLFSDADPFLADGGKKIYFISDRPVAEKSVRDLDIWWCDMTDTGWSMPLHLDGPVSSAGSEWFPCVAANGTLYFGSDRAGGQGRTDIYRSKLVDGRYGEPENLGLPINSPADEYECLISPDESYMILMATGRPGELGAGDLYASVQKDGKWSEPRLLGNSINSPQFEVGPHVSPDGRYFFFSSTRRRDTPLRDRPMNSSQLDQWLHSPGNGFGDIFQVDFTALGLP